MAEDTEITIWNNILKGAMAIPGVKVDREQFLYKELIRYYEEKEVKLMIEKGPTTIASHKILEKIAKGCINYQLTIVCSLSAAAGLPGGPIAVGAITADIMQFYSQVIILTQKLIYLYDWPNITDEDGNLDDNTANILTLFIGVMMGSKIANDAITQILRSFANQVVKCLPKQALTKLAIYNVCKQVAKWIGLKLTKEGFAKGLSKMIPLIGAPISATITYWTFKPMANKLHTCLKEQKKSVCSEVLNFSE